MEGLRQIAIMKIKSSRERFEKAHRKEQKQNAANDFKEGVLGLSTSLKTEYNQSIKNELKKKLPGLENQLVKMISEIKKMNEQPKKHEQKSKPSQKEQGQDKKKLQNALSEAIVKQKPNVKWDDVAGLQQAKKALQEAVILPIKFPEIFVGQRTPWKGILLYGPPGTGKTFLAKACATQMQKGTFFSVSSSDLMSKYVGESQKTIKTLFQMAREEKPSIIFIDEIDSMAGNRSDGQNEASRRVKTQFLVQMQGVGNDTTGVLVLGATNLPWALDPAIRRRFQRRVYIPLPQFRARLGLLTKLSNQNPNSVQEEQLQDLAEKTQGFSGSDISVLVRDAMFEPLRFCQSATKFVMVNENGQQKWEPCPQQENNPNKKYKKCSMHELPQNSLILPKLSYVHFLAALKKTRPSVNKADLQKYVEFTKSFGQDG